MLVLLSICCVYSLLHGSTHRGVGATRRGTLNPTLTPLHRSNVSSCRRSLSVTAELLILARCQQPLLLGTLR